MNNKIYECPDTGIVVTYDPNGTLIMYARDDPNAERLGHKFFQLNDPAYAKRWVRSLVRNRSTSIRKRIHALEQEVGALKQQGLYWGSLERKLPKVAK